MNTKRIPMVIGTKYGRWTIINTAPNEGIRTMLLCKCECGSIRTVSGERLRNGKSKSCGCYSYELTVQRSTVHGDAQKPQHYLYSTWVGIKQRVNNKETKQYKDYGERGIKITEEWQDDYIKFKTDILSKLGERPKGYSLDRINNNGNYELNNLRWATAKEQMNNTRYNVKH